jgi:hypothetical protein
MPYIKKEKRSEFAILLSNALSKLEAVSDDEIEGTLNYLFSEMLDSLRRGEGGKWRYKYINRAIGVLECCKLEFYRRLAGPYEEKAVSGNGDVNVYSSK